MHTRCLFMLQCDAARNDGTKGLPCIDVLQLVSHTGININKYFHSDHIIVSWMGIPYKQGGCPIP
eukprot:COSAG01_NODE_3942_length_5509_cov_11.737893_2_plen_65_part_00